MTIPATDRTAELRRSAVRDILMVSPGVIPFGIMLGVTAVTLGYSEVSTLFGAMAGYGGSAQLATVTVLHLGGGIAAAVLSGVVVNSRIMLYGAALQPMFRDQPLWFRLLGPQFILDQTYVSAVDRTDLDPEEFRRYWAWLGGTLLIVWSFAVGLGVVAGPLLPELPHLVMIPSGLFIAMLVPRLTGRVPVIAAVAAALTGVAVAHLAPSLGVLAGTVAGVCAGMVAAPEESP